MPMYEHVLLARQDLSQAQVDALAMTSSTSSSTAEKPPPITMNSLRKMYPGREVPAVANLTFSIHDGECFGLLGPNGAAYMCKISM